MDTRALREERAKLYEDNKAVLEAAVSAKRNLNAEEQEATNKRNARASEIKALLDQVEANEAEGRFLAESRGRKTDTVVTDAKDADAPQPRDFDLALRGWAIGERRATDEQRAAAKRVGQRLDAPYMDIGIRTSTVGGQTIRTYVPVNCDSAGNITGYEARALSVGTTTAGGNSVQNELMREFYEVQKWYGRVRNIAKSVQTETGATLPWPKVSDTANTGRVLAEATAATTTTDQTFSVVNLGAFKFSSDAVLVSWELLQDSFIDLSSYLGAALGTRLGRIQNTKFTIGAGTTEPQGVITGATTSAAAATNAFTLDEVITLIHAVDPAYRNLPGVQFMFHDTIAAYLRKFKDGQGRYYWETSITAGQPDRFFGFPVTINNDMDSALTTGKKLVAFGSFNTAFLIRDAGAVRLVRSDEKYILEHQVMFEASQRADSAVLDTTAIKVLTLA